MTDIKKLPVYFSTQEAAELCLKNYDLKGTATPLPGELDHNYKIETANNTAFVLKINRPGTDPDYLDFQENLLLHVQNKKHEIKFPGLIKTKSGDNSFTVIDSDNQTRSVRLLEWIPGRLWSSVNPISEELLFSLGETCGAITNLLQDFNHPKASRVFDWDIAQANWTDSYIHLFNDEQKESLSFFTNEFKKFQTRYSLLRKSVIHNDANDNNIIVSKDLLHPVVETIIDYGDAALSQTINDLAVAIAYAVMDYPDPLSASLPIIAGYHIKFPLKEEELEVLHVLVAIRLVISVSKSAINKEKEPDNVYLQISDKQAWDLLTKWKNIPPSLAHYSFRSACGIIPVPEEKLFREWAVLQQMGVNNLFPSINYDTIKQPDLSIGSRLLGNFSSYKKSTEFEYQIQRLQAENPKTLFAGGYLETRPFYTTASFKSEGNNGPEYRAHHLGMDFWLEANTPVHAICDGEIISFADNAVDKDYGPTIIIKHSLINGLVFYTLYGHLSKESLISLKNGLLIKKGDRIGSIGNKTENGNWPPHLHFQIILDLLGYETNFPGVCSPGHPRGRRADAHAHRVQFARILDALRRTGRHPQDVVRAPVGLGLGGGHERD